MTSYFQKKVQDIFFDELHIEVPSCDIDLIEEGYLDSARFIELLMILERDLNITVLFDQFEFDNFKTIEQIARFVEAQVSTHETRANWG